MHNDVHASAAVKVRVAVAESFTLLREGIVSLLSGYPHIAVVGNTGTGCDVVEMCKDAQPDILLLGASIAGELTRAHWEAISAQSPGSKVVLLANDSSHAAPGLYMTSVKGLLTWGDDTERLVKALSVVASGRTWESTEERFFSRRAQRGNDLGLSGRESEIAALVAQGLTNREIAKRLQLSEQSVKNMVSRILKKMGLTNRVQIAMRCWTH